MAMEFGPNWLQPIQKRLGEKYPHLSPEELDYCNVTCSKARDEGNNFIYLKLGEVAGKGQTITGNELELQLATFTNTKYQWISTENLGKLFSQGCYYAWKDGLIEALKG